MTIHHRDPEMDQGSRIAQDLPPGLVAGDVIYACYRWAEDGRENAGKKVRPCLVIKVAKDESSVILAPFSTRSDRSDANHLEIPEEYRSECGLSTNRRSFIKFNEINRIDLPNHDEIHTHVGPDGWLTARKGRVDDATLRQVQTEIGMRTHEKTIKGVRIPANARSTDPIKMTGLAAMRNGPSVSLSNASQRHMPGDPDARSQRQDAIRAKAAEARPVAQKSSFEKSSAITR